MRYVEVDGLRSSVIGLGTWQFGSREWGYGEPYATEIAPALVRRAVALGITMIDTAEAYGPGRSERIVGDVLRDLDPAVRDGLVVATKFLPIAPAEPVVERQASGSLGRLGVDALDLYYAHWRNPLVSARRTMQALRPLVDRGLVRRVGVSNHSLEAWQDAERGLRAPVVANQVRFSLASPAAAADLVPYAAAMGRLVVAYSPLGQGSLAHGAGPDAAGRSGGSRAAGRRGPGIRATNPLFRAAGRARLAPIHAALAEIAADHGATPAQVALAWVVGHPNTIAIPGARTLAQLEENAAAARLVLSAAEHARLTERATAFASRSGD